METMTREESFEIGVARMSKDLREAAKMMTPAEARFLVDTYYGMQKNRIRASNQVRALAGEAEPHSILEWSLKQARVLEDQIKISLDVFSFNQPLGEWARAQIGIGPVIAAGLLAHIDIEKAPTAGAIWRFAGLDPTTKWEKGKKRPWNASLKALTWKAGESFVKTCNKEDAFYGQLYKDRKEIELRKNEAGDFAEQAAEGAARVGKTTEAYKAYSIGKLPDGHLHARAKRWAVKRFLADYQTVGFFLRYGHLPPLPYPLVHMEGHTHLTVPQCAHTVPGLERALASWQRAK